MPFAGEPFAGQPFAGQPFAGEPFAGQVAGTTTRILGPAGLILLLLVPLGGLTKRELDAVQRFREQGTYDGPYDAGHQGAGLQPAVPPEEAAQGHGEAG